MCGTGLWDIRPSRAAFAAESACSLPRMPTWLGTQQNITFLDSAWIDDNISSVVILKRSCDSLDNAYNAYLKSEKMTKLSLFLPLIYFKAVQIADNYAVKINALSN